MPKFRIRIVNSAFSAEEEQEVPDFEAAKREGLKGALNIGVDQVLKGEPFFGAEVSVDSEGDQRVRFLVSVGASPLQ
jgi:hypothetical protein